MDYFQWTIYNHEGLLTLKMLALSAHTYIICILALRPNRSKDSYCFPKSCWSCFHKLPTNNIHIIIYTIKTVKRVKLVKCFLLISQIFQLPFAPFDFPFIFVIFVMKRKWCNHYFWHIQLFTIFFHILI